VALAISAQAGGQTVLPALPRLELDSYPPSTREAVSPALRAAAARPDDPAAVGALARVLHAWEQFDAAHEAYARAQALAPRAFEWHYLDGVLLERLKRHGEAAAQLEKAVAARPDYLAARLSLGEAFFEAGELDKSRALFEGLTGEPLAAPRVEFGLGRVDAAQDRHDRAILHFQKAIALFPEWGAAHYALARSYRATGRLEDAAQALQRHAQYGARWPGTEDPVLTAVNALRDDARANLQRGLQRAEAGDLQGAIAAHEAALQRDPDFAQAHANLIGLYGRTRDFAKAEEHYRATVALGFNLAEAHYDYAVLLAFQEKWAAAEEAYRRAIAVNPLHAEARNNLGQLLERRQAFEEAAAEYEKAVDARPSFRIARFNLGRMLLGLRRPQEAIAVFERLQEPQDAETPRYLFALSTAHARAGHKEDALKWGTEARRLALEFGQQDLAGAIERDLVLLK
jgi:tetratricopeptide (TPR) repeat protein